MLVPLLSLANTGRVQILRHKTAMDPSTKELLTRQTPAFGGGSGKQRTLTAMLAAENNLSRVKELSTLLLKSLHEPLHS